MDEEVPEVGAPGMSAETAREAMVLAVRVFGVTAARVQQAEREHAERGDIIAVLTKMLTDAQEWDPRIRAAFEDWRRKLVELNQHQGRDALQETTGAGEALVAGALGATARTARQAVLLAMRALGANASRVELAERGQNEFDGPLTVLMATPTNDQKGDAVLLAAWQGKGAAVALLLAADVDPNYVISEALAGDRFHHLVGFTPLIAAIRGGHEEILHRLLAAGADREKKIYGHRPLMWAAMSGCVACAENLLLAGASVNAQCEGGLSAMHHAARGNYASGNTQERDRRAALIVARLLEAGADKAPVNNDGRTARCYAEARGHTQAVALLLEWCRLPS